MRKKSHISLAWYLMNSEGMDSLAHHKGSLYFGSILPDCVPSFLVRKHSFDDSFQILEKEFQKLVSHFNPNRGADSYFCRHLGVITHYISDYFTFPHNANYPGNFKDHCKYEEELKHAIRSYVHSPEAVKKRLGETVHTPQEILAFIRRMHEIYMAVESVVKRDCEYIVALCHTVVDAILLFLENQMHRISLSVAV